MTGVGEVSTEAVERALAGNLVLGNETSEGNHGEAAVLDLLELEVIEVSGDNGGEDATGVTDFVSRELEVTVEGVGVDGAGLFEVAPATDLNVVHHEELSTNEGGDAERELDVLRGGVEVNVGLHDGLAKDTSDTEHGPAAVLELSLAPDFEVLGVGSEVEGVETEVTGHGAVEVSRGSGAGHPERARSLGLDGTGGGSLRTRERGRGKKERQVQFKRTDVVSSHPRNGENSGKRTGNIHTGGIRGEDSVEPPERVGRGSTTPEGSPRDTRVTDKK